MKEQEINLLRHLALKKLSLYQIMLKYMMKQFCK